MQISEDLKITIFDIVDKGRQDNLTSDQITEYVVKAIEKEQDDIELDIHITPGNKHYDKFIDLLNKCRH